jgi:hypothetical protein
MQRKSLFTSLLIALSGAIMSSSPAARTFVEPLGSSQTLRVMTYNIHVGVGMDKKLDLPRIAGVINAQHPDLVGLQEVDRGVTRTQGIDEIAELLGLKVAALKRALAILRTNRRSESITSSFAQPIGRERNARG